MSALREAQLGFVMAEWAADIGDDDPEAQEPFEDAMAILAETHPADLPEAAARLRFLLCVSERYSDCTMVREAMIKVAAWLALAASDAHRQDCMRTTLDRELLCA
jgi:hypothetical protein